MARDNDGIVVIGAGVVGAAVAYHLAALGHERVRVYDARERATLPGSTGLAPGFVGRLSATVELAVLAVDSVGTYLDLAALAPELAIRRAGCVEVATTPAAVEQAHRDVEHGRALGIAAEVLDAGAAVALAPGLIAEELTLGALHVPGDCAAEPVALTEALVVAAENLGARFSWGTPVRALDIERGRVLGVRTGAGVVPAAQVVLATGIWGPILAAQAGIRLPMVAVQHPYVYTRELPELAGVPDDTPIVRYPEQAVYTRRHGTRYGVGCYAHDPLVAEPDSGRLSAELPFRDADFDGAVATATELVPAFRDAPLGRRLNGVFALTPDELPLVGPVPGVAGLWTAEAAWVTHAAGVARQLAHQLLGRDDLLVDPARLAPDRFASWDADRIRDTALPHYRGIYDAH